MGYVGPLSKSGHPNIDDRLRDSNKPELLMSQKKSKTLPKKHLLFGIPINIAAGPLGFRAELDANPKGG